MTYCIYFPKKKKKKTCLKNMGQLDPTRDPTWPAIWLTRNPLICFDLQHVWPANPIDLTWPAHFATSNAIAHIVMAKLWQIKTLNCRGFHYIACLELVCSIRLNTRVLVVTNDLLLFFFFKNWWQIILIRIKSISSQVDWKLAIQRFG